MDLSTAQLSVWLGSFFWPFTRIGAMLTAMPLFGSRLLPVRIRLVIAVGLTVVLIPVIPPVPALDPLSPDGVMTMAQQLLIGFAMGFTLQLVLDAVSLGGQAMAMGMGLGFASMVDPQNGVQVPVLSQFLLIMATLLFLSLNGHLVALQILADSFRVLPIGPHGVSAASVQAVIRWSSQMWVGAVLIALPVMVSIMMVNIGFGVMMRAAPQLNIFAVGFPVTMLVGFALIMVTLPTISDNIRQLFMQSFDVSRALLAAGGR